MSSTSRGGKRSPADFYETRAWTLNRLLERLPLPGGLWLEPGAGHGAIIKAVNSRRNDVEWYAIEKREACRKYLMPLVQPRPPSFAPALQIADFLKWRWAGPRFDVSITNPAFSIGMEYILQTLPLAFHVIHLLRLNFLGTEERNEFFKNNMPDVYVIPDRVSFAKSISCMRNKRGCKYAKIVSLTARVPKACPRCGAKLRISSTDSIEYAWYHWGEERGRRAGKVEVLDHTPLEERQA